MSTTTRLPLIDALKAVASQLVVLHHLAFYGPLSDAAQPLAPALIGWLSHHARLAVQVFLVVGGYLAARRLAPTGKPGISNPLPLLGQRYWRLVMPYLLALSLAIVGAAIARLWMQHDSIPAAPGPAQLMSHILLLQDILGYEALTAGAWYIAIDFQLFAAVLAVIWLAQRLGDAWSAACATTAIAALGLLSLLYFNVDARWDPWALYFFGAYALGALAYWAGARERSVGWLVLLCFAGLAVTQWNFRPHTFVALATALVLAVSRRLDSPHRLWSAPAIGFLGRISYSVFLVHFPVCLVVNALVNRIAPGAPWLGALGMLLAWCASTAAGALFHSWVEAPLAAGFSLPARRLSASIPGLRALPIRHRV